MERKLARSALILPAAKGWKVLHAGGPKAEAQLAGSLTAAAELLGPNQPVHLALPSGAVVLERMTLPATDAEELEGMVLLQLEKSLPYPAEEITSSFQILSTKESESSVLAIAVNNEQLDTLCEPLRSRGRLPQRITLYALHVAASCPADRLTLAVYAEDGRFAVAICDRHLLLFLETSTAVDEAALLSELPQLLLAAELDGVPTTFAAIRVDHTAIDLRSGLEQLFGAPSELLPDDENLADVTINLLPASWKQERSHAASKERLKARLITAAIIYLVLVVCAFGYLIWLKTQTKKLAAEIRAQQPTVDFISSRQVRWNALSRAIDPNLFTVELLNQLDQARPGEDVRFTQFDQSAEGFEVQIEAPSATLAIDFGEQLKKNPALFAFKFDISPPAILPNDHAQMRVVAKL